MKRYIKCKCSVCDKRKTKSFYNLDGESKPICWKCMLKLADRDIENNKDKREAREKNLTKYIDVSIFAVIVVLLIGMIAYSKVFSSLDDIVKVFSNREKATYLILFLLINYFTGLLIGRLTQDSPLWFKIVAKLIMTFVTTLISCIVVIRDDLQIIEGRGLIIFISVLILTTFCIILFILNHKGIGKKKTLHKITILLVLLAGVIEAIAYLFGINS